MEIGSLHLFDDLAAEGEGQERAGRRLVEAARAEVEERRLVESSGRRAVRALHVVVVDLELRLRVDERRVREDQVPVRLVGVGLPAPGAARRSARRRRRGPTRRGSPCRTPGSSRAASRGRSACGCRRAGRPTRGRVRRATFSAPSPSRRTAVSFRTSFPPKEKTRERLWLAACCTIRTLPRWTASAPSRWSLACSRTAFGARKASVTAFVKVGPPEPTKASVTDAWLDSSRRTASAGAVRITDAPAACPVETQ